LDEEVAAEEKAAAAKSSPSINSRKIITRGNSYHAHKTEDGSEYYEDEATGETVWTLPDNSTLL
jgi:hypothetical protein